MNTLTSLPLKDPQQGILDALDTYLTTLEGYYQVMNPLIQSCIIES